jgi:hypothetical protein
VTGLLHFYALINVTPIENSTGSLLQGGVYSIYQF